MTIEKKLDALIDALGFDVEVIETITLSGKPLGKPDMTPVAFLPVEASDLRDIIRVIDYKLTKREVFEYKRHDEKINFKVEDGES